MKVNVRDLHFSIHGKNILQDMNFALPENSIVGLLGPNGAGKTTLLQILAGIDEPTSGNVLVNNLDPFQHKQGREQTCLIIEDGNFPVNFKIKEVLSLAKSFYPNWSQEKASALLNVFNLEKDLRVRQLSKGMGNALAVTVGIASRAPLTLFDEPFNGMDVQSRQVFYKELLEDYVEVPRTIILSTHFTDEVSKMFNHIVLVNKGTVPLSISFEQMQKSCFKICGLPNAINELTTEMEVLHSESFAGKETRYVYSPLRPVPTSADVEVEVMSLREVMLYWPHTLKEVATNV
ncbi:ABC transporter ATP-binding protein [Mangrovibacillus cuniculi]|uniref:ABC transporter ATP-binding protein n=1 Tax=Mangrovibacillus cuniculi TaxID=2593652 RepID=A0A7S8CCS3_9BACI|nr:ABC transporter ATP-binding protein [Mangrovibacillus cuniculi]QPC47612.1 ABC transporter ATP-binding protein [Mangrovibacillus cuniculi]